MSARHLGDKIHDLIDGRLTGDKAYAAMAHLGECEDCAARWHQLRAAREALSTAEAGIDMSFAQRLLDRDRIAEIAAHEEPSKARAGTRRNRRPVFFAFGIVAVASAVTAVGWFAGAPGEVGLEFTSAMAGSAKPVTYMGAQGMRSGDQLRKWIHPDFAESGIIPIEAKVMQRTNGTNVLVATLLQDLDVVVVTEEHGRLSAPALQEMPRANVDGIDVYVVSFGAPSQVVWQTGDVVIALACECDLRTLEAVAGSFPTADDPGFVDRVGGGLSQLVGASSD